MSIVELRKLQQTQQPTRVERRVIALLHLVGPLTMVVTAVALLCGTGQGLRKATGVVEDPVLFLYELYGLGWSFLTAVVIGCLALTVYAVSWGWRRTSPWVRSEVDAWLRFELTHAGIVFVAPAALWIVVFLTLFMALYLVVPLMVAWPCLYVVWRLGTALAVLSAPARAPDPDGQRPSPPPRVVVSTSLWVVAALMGFVAAAMIVAAVAWAPWLLLGAAPLSLFFALAALALADAARDRRERGAR